MHIMRAISASFLAAVVASAQPTAPEWSFQAGPVRNSGMQMVYDPEHDMAIAVGGCVAYTSELTLCVDEAWAWTGSRWRFLTEDAPTTDGERLCYDPIGERVLLVGYDDPSQSMQVWTTDGVDWELLDVDQAISERADFSLAFDSARDRLVLHGGALRHWDGTTTRYDETWEWDGQDWTLAATGTPSALTTNTIVYDEARAVVLAFGGLMNGIHDETWAWDGAAWTQVADSGPAPRYAHGLIYDSDRARVMLLGGILGNGFRSSEVWAWDGQAWAKLPGNLPGQRAGPAVAFDSTRGTVLLHSGLRLEESTGELWSWDGDEWTLLTKTAPQARHSAVLTYDEPRQRTILYGGRSVRNDQAYFADTWAWSAGSWTKLTTPSPPPEWGMAMVYDSQDDQMVLVGGRDRDGTVLGTTWTFANGRWTDTQASGLPPRYEHAAAYDRARDRVVTFGGYGSSTTLSDTWEWDGQGWTELAIAGPDARAFHVMAFDEPRGRVVLAGGRASGTEFHDTWEFDGASWTLLDSKTPPDFEAMTFVPSIGACVAISGRGQMWRWTGSRWIGSPSVPFRRSRGGIGVAYDENEGALITFGGWSGVWATAETRMLPIPFGAFVKDSPEDLLVRPGATARLSMRGLGSAALGYQWTRDGVPMQDGETGSGSTVRGALTDTLLVHRPSDGDAGAYRCEISCEGGSDTSEPALLRVACLADFNLDESVDTRDFVAYLDAWASQRATGCLPHRCEADADMNGVVDSQDFVRFLNAWANGC